jgi:hypothetical protein
VTRVATLRGEHIKLEANECRTLEVRRLLGIETRYELDGFFKEHGVYLNYSIEDLGRDTEVSRASAIADDGRRQYVASQLPHTDR